MKKKQTIKMKSVCHKLLNYFRMSKQYSRSLLFIPLFFNLLLLFSNQATAQNRYNVIFINIDDLSTACGLYGNSFAPTPNLQRLAEHGVTFRNVYTQYSLCSPSRTSLFSGRRPSTTKITDNVELMTTYLGSDFQFINEYFHDFGYRTECYGKFSCNHEKEMTWDYYYNAGRGDDKFDGSQGQNSSFKTNKTYDESAQVPYWYIDTTSGGLSATNDGNNTNNFIKSLDTLKTRPFFINLGIQTHNPFTPLLEFWNKTGDPAQLKSLPVDSSHTYTNIIGNGSANIPLPINPVDDTNDIPKIALKEPFDYPDSAVQNLRHAYYAEMIQMDSLVGKIINELDSKNLWDSSVIVFWSDHGLSMGEHDGQWLKLNLFKEALQVPMIICAPHRQKGVWCDQLVELVDIFQTLTELCGIDPQGGQEGASMVPLLDNPSFDWKKVIFSNLKKPMPPDTILATSARTTRWHYNSWTSKAEELYDLVNDPSEITNLAKNPSYIDTLNLMRTYVNNNWQAALPPAYTRKTFYKDQDRDGYGKSDDSLWAYAKPVGFSLKKGDCDDKNQKVNPGAKESPCNGVDDNCSNGIDETRPVPAIWADGSLDICLTGKVTLSTNHGNGLSYQWTYNNINIPGATNRSYVATFIGNYAVRITKGTDCNNVSPSVNVYYGCFSDNQISVSGVAGYAASPSLIAFPNPSSGIFTLKYTSEADSDMALTVYNAAGQILFTQTINAKVGSNSYKLDLSNLKPGVYELVLDGNRHLKLIRN